MQDDNVALQNAIPSGATLGFDPDGLAQMLLIGTVVSIVLMVLLIVYIILNTAHRWRSEKAMVQMQKDIGEIRDMVEKAISAPPQPPMMPTDSSSQNSAATTQKPTERAEDA